MESEVRKWSDQVTADAQMNLYATVSIQDLPVISPHIKTLVTLPTINRGRPHSSLKASLRGRTVFVRLHVSCLHARTQCCCVVVFILYLVDF